MICAECGHEHDAPVEVCSACGKDPLLDGRYRLLSIIGQGAFGTTWKGIRVEDDHPVCLKELLYQRLASFEPEEQFRREASVLRQLDLPGVPDYVDDFTITTGRAVSLFLVQELVEGETLAEEMDSKRYREDEVLDIVDALLHILADLHELSPPVVHRDIKPSNVMRRTDGSLVLIDFGAVKDVLDKTRRGGPSVAGTIGFMAPEQLQGRAEPATDLFGTGALAVALLSRRDPAELLGDDGDLDWERHVAVSPRVKDFLASLLSPSISGRPASARAAIEALEQARTEPEDAPKPTVPAKRSVSVPVPEPEPEVQPPVVEPPPRRRDPGLPIVAGLTLVSAVVGAVIVFSVVRSKADTMPGGPPSEPRYTVPTGILELELGMTLEEAKASGADVASGQPDAVPSAPGRVLNRDPDPSPRLRGAFWGFSTTIAGQIARCQLEFAVEDRLSRIACSFDPFRTAEGFDAAARSIKRQLGKRYDLPAGVCAVQRQAPVVMGTEAGVQCIWTDTNASLALTGRFSDMMMGVLAPSPGQADISDLMRTSVMRLSLESKAHEHLVNAQRESEERQRQRVIDEALSEQRAREEAERRRIEEAASRGL
jgi:serine/threonine protein kinase